jgi:4-amino-4-deoxy-L-arabinose transferase-like glycosyltransferase
MRFINDLAERPDRAVLVLCATQATVWSLAPILSHSSPPLDVVEMYAWGREWVVATHKHPALPGLVLDPWRWLTGGLIWTAYLVSQLFVVATFLAVYVLGRDLLGSRRALAGTLFLTGIYYFSWRTPQMNNNLSQLPLWAGLCLSLWRATRTGRWGWWVALGVFGGLTLWAKYSAGVLLVVALVWLVVDRQAQRCFLTPGPWIALAVFGAVVAPQIGYLLETDFLPIRYAQERVWETRAGGTLSFLGAQIGMHFVFFLMAAFAGFFGRGASKRDPTEAPARRFLTLMGIGPLVVVMLLAVVTGMRLKDGWGAPMFNLSGLLLVAWLPGRFDGVRLRRLLKWAAALLLVVPVVYVAILRADPWVRDEPKRVAWPQREIAAELIGAFEKATGRPPRIVAGNVWEAGLVALDDRDISVFIDGAEWASPWISPEEIARHGVLAVWRADTPPAPDLEHLVGDRPVHEADFVWSPRESAPRVRIRYAIIPPAPRDVRGPR